MTEEFKTKKNTDYSDSAVNLGEHEVVKNEYNTYRGIKALLEAKEAELEQTELYREIQTLNLQLSSQVKIIKEKVEEFGSWQDIERGFYAVKQTRTSKSYLAEPFSEHFPKLAPAVIEQAVNVKALEGLIKGGLLKEEELDAYDVISKSTSYAYIIK